MSAHEVHRVVEYSNNPPDIRNIWMVSLSMMERVEHFAESERSWLQSVFNQKTRLIVGDPDDEENWTTQTLEDYLTERGILRRRLSS